MSGFEVIESENAGAPIKAWTKGVPIEEAALKQLRNVAGLPFIHSHLAVRPDVHWGKGATVGSVIATDGAIIPAAVGVDIGCGMMAVRTSLRAEHLPDNLAAIRSDIEAAVPHGRTDNGGANDVGAHRDEVPANAKARWEPDRRETCAHLAPIEGDMRAAGLTVRYARAGQIEADCVIDQAALAARYPLPEGVGYREVHIPDRSLLDPPMALVSCGEHGSSIYVVLEGQEREGTRRFPA